MLRRGYIALAALWGGACATPFDVGDTNFHCVSDTDCLAGYACQNYPGSTRALCLSSPRWEKRTDGTVVDHHLRLKWQDDVEGGEFLCTPTAENAWRVPTIDELRSLVDPRDCPNTALGGGCDIAETPEPCLADSLDCNPADICRDCSSGRPGASCYHDEEVWGENCPPRPLFSTSMVADSEDGVWVLNLGTGRITRSDNAPEGALPLTRCVTGL